MPSGKCSSVVYIGILRRRSESAKCGLGLYAWIFPRRSRGGASLKNHPATVVLGLTSERTAQARSAPSVRDSLGTSLVLSVARLKTAHVLIVRLAR